MTHRPVIGVTTRRVRLAALSPQDAALLTDETAEVHLSAFNRQLVAAGALPWPLPWDAEPGALLDRLDGLLLSGGEDVDPARSGAPSADAVAPDRDRFELALVEGALTRGLPVLGICRGLQLLNVALGGTLGAAPALHDRRDVPFAVRSHTVDCVAGSPLEALLGPDAAVNSVHRQAVARLAPALRVGARAPDGTLEAAYDPERALLGVQWHPEFHALGDPVIAWLAERAVARPALDAVG